MVEFSTPRFSLVRRAWRPHVRIRGDPRGEQEDAPTKAHRQFAGSKIAPFVAGYRRGIDPAPGETPMAPRFGVPWAFGVRRIPAMTDFRARGTIMGLAGLTAVFGMGTGGAPPV